MKPELSDRLTRVKGLLGGIQKMIQEDKPVEQIAQQLKAAHRALQRAEWQIVEYKIRTAKPEELSGVMDWVFKVIK